MKFMMNGKRFLGTLALLSFILSSQVSGASVAPLEQIKGTVEGILAVMQDESLSAPAQRAERRTRIMALVNERFDFAEMSKRTLGRNWKARTKEEREEFQELFSDLLKNTYIGRVEAYSDERVEYAKEVFGRNKSDRAKVYTKILKNGHEIPINYSLMKKGDEWFVYDVVIEGVSMVRNYRTEFGRILNKEKFPGLVKRMQEKIKRNEAKREK
jgi:phospholipid transport system substrate-binding protein